MQFVFRLNTNTISKGNMDTHEDIELSQETQARVHRQVGTEEKKTVRVLAAAFCFLVAGVNDGSLGALVPYLLRSYGLTPSSIGLVWGLSFIGWLLAALTGSWMRSATGLGGALVAGAAAQLAAHLLRFWVGISPCNYHLYMHNVYILTR